MTSWFPWPRKGGEPEGDEGQIADSSTPLDEQQKPGKAGDEDHPMILDPPEQPLTRSHGDLSNVSLHNNADAQYRKNKRPSEGPTDNLEEGQHTKKGRRSQSPSATCSASSHGHDEPDDLEKPLSMHYDISEDNNEPPAQLVLDLETKAITVSQLIQEVKGIYSGLVMVERKCIEIVKLQTESPTKLSKEQWQALIALHRTLLNEHHDFFSASHHPITEKHELRDLAARYAMPARMWRHGIHGFLELLRHRLPGSLEHMLSFVYLAYSMMALLKETIPDFKETWIECLGDLARYRMAIEESDLRDREIWSSTARTWYNEAGDLSPNTGRIQHHLAVLARPNIVQQLFLYSKALVAAIPFRNASESILLLFNPLDQPNATNARYQPAELNLVCSAFVLFKKKSKVEFDGYRGKFIANLEAHMARTGSRFKVQGPEIAGSLFAMLMDFGNSENKLWSMLNDHQQKLRQQYCRKHNVMDDKLPKDFVVNDPSIIDPFRRDYWKSRITTNDQAPLLDVIDGKNFNSSDETTSYVGLLLLHSTISIVASHIGNKNVVPFMLMVLAHLYSLTWVPGASVYIERFIPWDKIVQFLNTVGRSGVSYENIESTDSPRSFAGNKRQLPEDFVMRGLMALTYNYKPNFFALDDLVDEDERLLEQPSHQAPRVERCLHAAIQLANLNHRWLAYDKVSKEFSVTAFSRNLTVD